MATTFAGTFNASLAASYVKADDFGDAIKTIAMELLSTYSNGTGANQANAIFTDTFTLPATSGSYDLNAITDAFGTILNFTKVKLLYVKNKSILPGAAQNLTLSGDFLSAMDGGTGPTHIIGPGGVFVAESPIDGYTVTNTTQDTLTLTNAVSFDYDIIILGTV